jgi:glucose/arabinose dehydrogenase
MARRVYRFGWAAALISLLAVGSAAAQPLEPTFSEAVLASSPELEEATGMAWAPDGSNRLFIIRKAGQVRIIKAGSLLPQPFAVVSPIFTASECGLIGIAFDPAYAVNGHVYLFVTVSSTEQQILRYTAEGDIGTEKTLLVAGLPTVGANHDGGAIEVGPDGKLFFGVGDVAYPPSGDDLRTMAAKIGRADLDGMASADNPFRDGDGPNNDYIWARGLRNPFSLTFQPMTGLLWVNDVGAAYEQVFVLRRGEHAGWPAQENPRSGGGSLLP